MKKIIYLLIILLLVGCTSNSDLPLPELEDGIRGSQLGIDKNINEETIDNYLNRSDSIYIDCRMLKDEANYEAIGGDSYLSGYINGFEVVPYPYLCNVVGLPEEVGSSYVGATLFTQNDNGTYSSNYEESEEIINELFPKDKVIFLMCGGGGYAGMTKNLLVSLGYNQNKIYNVGGYWYYKGKNSIITTLADGSHDFSNVPYHYIDFSELTAKDGYDPNSIIHIDPRDNDSYIISINSLDSLDGDYLLLVSMSGCSSCASFRPILNEYAKTSELKVYEIDISIVQDILDVKYTPSLLLYKNNSLIDSLDPMDNEDIKYYESVKELNNWISKH